MGFGRKGGKGNETGEGCLEGRRRGPPWTAPKGGKQALVPLCKKKGIDNFFLFFLTYATGSAKGKKLGGGGGGAEGSLEDRTRNHVSRWASAGCRRIAERLEAQCRWAT